MEKENVFNGSKKHKEFWKYASHISKYIDIDKLCDDNKVIYDLFAITHKLRHCKLKDLVCTINDDGIVIGYDDHLFCHLGDLWNYISMGLLKADMRDAFISFCNDFICTSALLCWLTHSTHAEFNSNNHMLGTNNIVFEINSFNIIHVSNKMINKINDMDDNTRYKLYTECRFAIVQCVNDVERKTVYDYFHEPISWDYNDNRLKFTNDVFINTAITSERLKTTVYVGKEYELESKRYLQEKYPEYKVYLWREFNDIIPTEQRSVDIGIDIVCIDPFGKLIGVQCKNYSKGNLNLSNLSTFFSSTQLSYTINNISRKFGKLIIVSQPSIKMSKQLKQFITNLDKPVEFLKLAS